MKVATLRRSITMSVVETRFHCGQPEAETCSHQFLVLVALMEVENGHPLVAMWSSAILAKKIQAERWAHSAVSLVL